MKKMLLFACVLFVFGAEIIFAQIKPRVAALPFTTVNVAENEARVVTILFETALVQTESFLVVEQNQISEILSAQEFTLTGCTDEACAVEIGKLLTAEQIILGTVSILGGKYILNAKIIDVERGENLKAVKTEADNIEGLSNAAEVLAYALAGLTMSTGGSDMVIAREFGQIFVMTDPDGADIFVNGVKRGLSPELLSKIPLGMVTIEARKDNLYARQQLEVGSDIVELELTLKVTLGSLFVKSSRKDVEVYLDGKNLGALGTGLFKDLPVGTHTVELKSKTAYWRGEVSIEEGQAARVDASPRAFGSLRYAVPDGAAARVLSGDFDRTLTGTGYIDTVYTGSYVVEVSGRNYETKKISIKIEEGRETRFEPELDFSAAYLKENEAALQRKKAALSQNFTAKVVTIEQSAAGITNTTPLRREISTLKDQLKQAAAEGFAFTELDNRLAAVVRKLDSIDADMAAAKKAAEAAAAKEARLSNLRVKQNALREQYYAAEARYLKAKKSRWVWLGTGLAGAAGGAAAYFLADSAYAEYLNASDSLAAAAARSKAETFEAFTAAGGGIGGAGLLGFLLTNNAKDPRPDLERQIIAVTRQIAELE